MRTEETEKPLACIKKPDLKLGASEWPVLIRP
jgi:hypothetical protein